MSDERLTHLAMLWFTRDEPKVWIWNKFLTMFINMYPNCHNYTVSQKIPPEVFFAIFPKRSGIFRLNFTCLLCVPIYATLRILIQLLATLTKLCHIKRDHQFTSCAQNVHLRPKCTLAFSNIFHKRLGIFRPRFARLFNVHIYARIQIFYVTIFNSHEVMPY